MFSSKTPIKDSTKCSSNNSQLNLMEYSTYCTGNYIAFLMKHSTPVCISMQSGISRLYGLLSPQKTCLAQATKDYKLMYLNYSNEQDKAQMPKQFTVISKLKEIT
jgi:hypothetical protein